MSFLPHCLLTLHELQFGKMRLAGIRKPQRKHDFVLKYTDSCELLWSLVGITTCKRAGSGRRSALCEYGSSPHTRIKRKFKYLKPSVNRTGTFYFQFGLYKMSELMITGQQGKCFSTVLLRSTLHRCLALPSRIGLPFSRMYITEKAHSYCIFIIFS